MGLPPDLEDQARTLARRFALLNAVEHGADPNPGAVMGKLMGEVPELRPHAQHVNPLVQDVVSQVNEVPADERRSILEEEAPELLEEDDDETPEDQHPLPELPGDTSDVVMRFAPNPNGPLTLGHSRGVSILAEYRDRYDGTLILRYDDTDPVIKAPQAEMYDVVADDLRWLAGEPDRVLKASERLGTYYDHARTTIELDGAYVCECTQEAFRELKNAKEACPHRGRSTAENLEAWDRMLEGGYEPGEAVVRVKTDITHKDPALRDWVAFRIVDIAEHPHPITGREFAVWPMLDLQSAVEDHLQGVTHIIRGKDLMDSTRKQRFLYEHQGWTYPETLYWGRVKLHGFGKFSTSQLSQDIAEGRYDGWDDPRLPTLQALRRRGFTPEGIREFWMELGLTEKDVAASSETLDAANRKVVEPQADRFFLVRDPVEVTVATDEPLEGAAPLHPDDPERGVREHHLNPTDGTVHVLLERADLEAWSPGDRVRLKDLGNIEITGTTTARYIGNDLDILQEGDVDIVHWCPPFHLPVTLLMPDGEQVEGLGEPQLRHEEEGSVVQFERVGFARLDHVGEDGIVAVYAHR